MAGFFRDFASSEKGKLATDITRGIRGAVSFAKGNPGGDGFLAEDVEFVSGVQKTIQHSLGQTPVGFIIAAKSAVVDATLDEKTSTSITVTPNANATVTLWIF